MSGKQATLGTGTPVITEDTLREKLEDNKWNTEDLADDLGVREKDVKRALNHHGINYNPHATDKCTSGKARTLTEMDPEEFDEQVLGGESA